MSVPGVNVLSVASIAAALVAGVLVAAQPAILLASVAVGLGVFLVTKPLGRLIMFVGGVIVIFQSASFGFGPRGLFLALVVAGVVPAAISAHRASVQREFDLRPFMMPIGLILLLVGMSALLLMVRAGDVSSWLRDATTYILIAVAPVYGLDAALRSSPSALRAFTMLVGFVGAFAFMIAWLSRRGISVGGLDQFALASSMLAVPSIAMCLVVFYTSTRLRWLWISAALIQSAMLVGAGGRSSVIYLGALFAFFLMVGMLWGSGGSRSIALVIALVTGGLVVFGAARLLGLDSFLVDRYDWFNNVSFEAVRVDASGALRLRAYGFMWEAFLRSPILGNGFGISYPNVYTGRVVEGTFTLDTPLVYLAKFGVVGTLTFFVAIGTLVSAVVRSAAKSTPARRRVQLLMGGALVVWLAVLPSGAPSEQKGFAVSVLLLVAVGASWAVRPQSANGSFLVGGRAVDASPAPREGVGDGSWSPGARAEKVSGRP